MRLCSMAVERQLENQLDSHISIDHGGHSTDRCSSSLSVLQMFTVVVPTAAEGDQVQTRVVIPNQEELTERHRIIMCHRDNRNLKTKARHD